ncbi:fimbrial protein [Serratia ficaria]|uniref:fimbrial protein n=1 Tax=Serratia ficaria TaxID=61651 RepID=UPI003703AED7
MYQKIDDYFSIATYRTSNCGKSYAPFNVTEVDKRSCRPIPLTGYYVDGITLNSTLKITRRLIGGTYEKRIYLGTLGGCKGLNCGRQDLVYARVYLNYSIVVPQNCTINAGQIVNVDFGEISSSAFKIAGARAEGVNPQSRTINMQCTNIQAQANLTLRVQADSVSGNAIVSDNRDIGFVVADAAGKELTPNMLSSVIPFRLDDNASAHVPVKVWPVSVTGQKPKEGVVTSRAYLRVDFD